MEHNIRLNWQSFVKAAVKRRKQQGLTQVQLSLLVEVSKPTLVSFEKGETKISLGNAIKILKILGLD